MSIQDYFDKLPTRARIYNGAENSLKKQRLYFGCNSENIPTVIIKWCETGRGFGEYAFQLINDQMICDSEGDSKEAVKRILNIMVDQCKFVGDGEENEKS